MQTKGLPVPSNRNRHIYDMMNQATPIKKSQKYYRIPVVKDGWAPIVVTLACNHTRQINNYML